MVYAERVGLGDGRLRGLAKTVRRDERFGELLFGDIEDVLEGGDFVRRRNESHVLVGLVAREEEVCAVGVADFTFESAPVDADVDLVAVDLLNFELGKFLQVPGEDPDDVDFCLLDKRVFLH